MSVAVLSAREALLFGAGVTLAAVVLLFNVTLYQGLCAHVTRRVCYASHSERRFERSAREPLLFVAGVALSGVIQSHIRQLLRVDVAASALVPHNENGRAAGSNYCLGNRIDCCFCLWLGHARSSSLFLSFLSPYAYLNFFRLRQRRCFFPLFLCSSRALAVETRNCAALGPSPRAI